MGRVLSYKILWAFGIPKEGSTSVRGYRQAVDKLVLGRALKQSLLSALCLRTGLCMQFAITQEPAGKMQNRAVSYMKESSLPGQHFLSSSISFCVNISILDRKKRGQPFVVSRAECIASGVL